jgi:hypothetical protein
MTSRRTWRRALACGLATLLATSAAGVAAQRRRTPAPKITVAPAEITCPQVLGIGVTTGREFCDVLTGREPADGILIKIPPHRGEAKLLFDLHNRQTYSEEQVKAGRAYARYTAFVGVLTMNNDLVARAVVQSEFRTAKDLFDRVRGGAGPSGLKAVAPLSVEPITIVLPDKVDEVSLLGEKLEVERLDGRFTYASPGQVVAIASNIRIAYQPAPVRRRR